MRMGGKEQNAHTLSSRYVQLVYFTVYMLKSKRSRYPARRRCCRSPEHRYRSCDSSQDAQYCCFNSKREACLKRTFIETCDFLVPFASGSTSQASIATHTARECHSARPTQRQYRTRPNVSISISLTLQLTGASLPFDACEREHKSLSRCESCWSRRRRPGCERQGQRERISCGRRSTCCRWRTSTGD